MADRFYLNSPLGAGAVALQGEEAHHLAVVCRLRAGDAVRLFNGDGHEYPAQVVSAGKRHVELDVGPGQRIDRELPFALELAVPLPKGDRAQFLVEKLTELGVTTYLPLRTERSVISPGEGKLDKLERYVIEASKQCGRNVLMTVSRPADWSDFATAARPGLRLLAHPGGAPLPSLAPGQPVTAAVGPEGGFTEAEVALARSHGWQIVTLGPRLLRVETAGLALAALVAGAYSR